MYNEYALYGMLIGACIALFNEAIPYMFAAIKALVNTIQMKGK